MRALLVSVINDIARRHGHYPDLLPGQSNHVSFSIKELHAFSEDLLTAAAAPEKLHPASPPLPQQGGEQTGLSDDRIDRCLSDALEAIAAQHNMNWNEVRTDIAGHATLRREFARNVAAAVSPQAIKQTKPRQKPKKWTAIISNELGTIFDGENKKIVTLYASEAKEIVRAHNKCLKERIQ